MRNKKIRAWAVIYKSRNGIFHDLLYEYSFERGRDIKSQSCLVITPNKISAKRWAEKWRSINAYEIIPVEIKLLSPNKK